MTPLRVTIRLGSPWVVPRHPLHLDAVLAALRVQEAEDAGDPNPYEVQHDLPLERYTAPSGEWVFRAGILRPLSHQGGTFLVTMTGRANLIAIAEDVSDGLVKLRSGSINPAGGPFRSSIFNLHAQWVDTLFAEAVGDPDRIGELLQRLEFLGARRSSAMGRVLSVSVDPINEARWHDRVLPEDADLELSRPMALAMGNLRVPYWRRTTVQPVLSPLDWS